MPVTSAASAALARRHDDRRDALAPGHQHHGQDAGHAAARAVEGQLADEQHVAREPAAGTAPSAASRPIAVARS